VGEYGVLENGGYGRPLMELEVLTIGVGELDFRDRENK